MYREVQEWFCAINTDLGLYGLRLALLFWDLVNISERGTEEAKRFISEQMTAIKEIIP